MNVTCVQADLKAALLVVKKQVPVRSTLPVLTSVKIDAVDGLSLTASNLETFIVKTIPAKVSEAGSILLPVGILSELVSSLPNEPVTLRMVKSKVAVDCGRFKANINCMSSDEFPAIPQVEPSLEFNADVLKDAIGRVVYAAAKDDVRPTLNGVQFKGGDILRLTAADGFRLATVSVPIQSEGLNAIVPIDAVKDLYRLVSGIVRVGTNANVINLQFDGTLFGSRLIDGTYPDISRVTPRFEDATTRLTVNTAELMRAINTVATVAVNSSVTLGISNPLIVSCANNEIGDTRAELDAEVEGSNVEIKVNYRYILEMLGTMPERVTFFVINPSAPLLIKPIGNDNLLVVVMPMSGK